MYSDLLAQFDALTKDLKPQQPVQQLEVTRVVAEEGLECWLKEKEKELTYTGTLNLERNFRSWQAELLRQVQILVRRLPASKQFNETISDIKKRENHV